MITTIETTDRGQQAVTGEPFGEDYFMNGIETGKSNYVNYTWMPELTLPMAEAFIEIFGIKNGESVLDFGCARGYFVRALRERGVRAFGVDASEWAIKNCDSSVAGYLSNKLEKNHQKFDYIFSKDVLEHIPTEELVTALPTLFTLCNEAAIFIVPLAHSEGGKYIYPSDELDNTHIHRKTIDGWLELIQPLARGCTIFTSTNIAALKKPLEQFRGSAGLFYCKKIKKERV
jgi:SAM-dependent methyltransferase